MLAGYEKPYDVTGLRKDGSTFPAEIQGHMFNFMGKPTQVTALQDNSVQQQAREALRESEEKYRSLTDDVLDNSAVGIFILNSDFRVVWVNQALEDYFGLKRDEIIGKDKRQLIRKRIQGIIENPDGFGDKIFSTYDNNTYIECFQCHVLPDGERQERWLEHQSYPIQSGFYAGGRIEHYYDITAMKQAQRTLRESEEKYRSMMEAMKDPAYICSPDFRVEYMNPAMVKRTGRDAIGEPCYKVINELDKKCPWCVHNKVQQGESLKTEIASPKDSCSYSISNSPIFHQDGSISKMTIYRDITEHKQAEEALRYFQKAIDSASDAIGMSTPEGKHYYQNKVFTELFGLTIKETDGEQGPPSTVYSNEKTGREVFETIMEGGSWTGEVKMLDKNRKEIDVFLRAYSIKDKKDNVVGLVGVHTDIASRKQAEEALRESEKLHKKAQSVAHIGHWELNPEIGTPVWSDEIFRIFGLNPQESEPSFTDHETHLHPDDWPLLNKAVTLASTEGTPFDIIFRIVRSDGEIRWMHSIGTTTKDEKGKVTKLFGTAQDITDSKQAEETLRESENNLKQAQKVSHVGSWDLDVVTGTLYWSDEAYRIYGFKPQEFAPTYENFQAIIHPEDHERVQKAVDAALSSAPDYDIDFRFIRPDGQTGWIHCDGQVTHDGEGKPIRFFGTQIDITERKQAEEALRVSEEKYRTLLENLPQKIFHKNKTLTYASCNENYAQDLKINPDDIAGKTDYDFYPRDLAEKYRADDKRIIKSGKTEEIQEGYVLGGKDFIVQTMKTPVLDETGNVTGILGIFWDITEQQRNREELKESEEKFRTLFDTSPHAIALTEMKTGKLIDVNDKLCKVSKYTRDELIDRTTTQFGFYSEDDRNRFVNELTNSGKVHDLEMEFEIKDGSILNTRMFATSMQLKGEVFILTEFYDITEQKGLEAKLQRTQKMEAIGTLAGGIAHEFNNTLMGIMGNIELLKMNFSKDEGIDKHLESMKSAGHRMSRLTDQLLAYAEGGKYQPKNLKIDDFVIETLPILQHDLSPTVRVETHFQKDISFVNADNAQMQMVLSAILTNSNEAIEDAGLIKIAAENVDIDEDFIKQHPGLKPGPYVSLTIEDDGKGMDEETKRGIFEPFFTTKFQGRGMGMAAVYGIVRNHNGWIYMDSELGRGTTIRIYLPTIEIEIEKPKEAKADVSTGSGTILMIEDEDVVIEVTQAMLEMLGYRVMVAKTGKDAIHIAETFDGQIDLVLLDIKLPDIEGRNLYPLIMKPRSNLKVIVFSGYSIDGPAREILDAGAQDFIQKPFSIATLSEKLKEVLEGK